MIKEEQMYPQSDLLIAELTQTDIHMLLMRVIGMEGSQRYHKIWLGRMNLPQRLSIGECYMFIFFYHRFTLEIRGVLLNLGGQWRAPAAPFGMPIT